MTNRAVFLDRDGVINRNTIRCGKPYPPYDLNELEILPGVLEGLLLLRKEGFRLIVVTNQPDVARGKQTRAGVEAIHDVLREQLPLDEFLVCYHDDADQCACRKPAPGLLLDAAAKHGLDLAESFMVGDRWKDVDAGKSAGCRTVFIDYGYDEKQPISFDMKAKSLVDAARWICSTKQCEV